MCSSEVEFLKTLTEATEGAFAAGTLTERLERLFHPFLRDGTLRRVAVQMDGKVLIDLTAELGNTVSPTTRWLPEMSNFPDQSLTISCDIIEGFDEIRRAIVCKLFVGVVRFGLTETELQGLRDSSGETTERVAALYDISEPNDSIELHDLLEVITKRACDVMGAQACSMMRLHPETHMLSISASHGLDDTVRSGFHQAWGEGIAGQVAMTGESRLLIDETPESLSDEWRQSIGSSMIVPMKNKAGSVMGVLSIRRRRPSRDFNSNDLRLFTLLARQAAMVIDNKEQYDDLQQYVREQKSLSELTLAISTQEDIDLLFEQVADSIIDVVEFDRCAIFLKDDDGPQYHPRIIRGYPERPLTRTQLLIGTRLSKRVIGSQESIIATDLDKQPESVRTFAQAIGVDSFVAIPIVVDDVSIGAVVADNFISRRAIRKRSIELLRTFISQTGIACQVANLNRDVRRQMEEQERIAQHVSNVLASLGEAVLVVNEALLVTDSNQPSTELFTHDLPIVGSSFTDLIEAMAMSIENRNQIVKAVRVCSETGQQGEVSRVSHKHGAPDERLFDVLVNPLRPKPNDLTGTVIMFEDVTDATRREMESHRLKRLADIGQIAAIVAHEVRNPLGAIRAGAQVMGSESGTSDTTSEMADIIIAEVDHLTKITTDMLEFAGPMVSEFQFVDLNQVVARTIALLRPAFDQALVGLSSQYDNHPVTLVGDPRLLEQMLRNLLLNALQATPHGGSVTVKTEFDIVNGKRLLRITDTGEGIDPSRIAYIFQPFITTRVKGTGLGLPLVRRIVEDHYGSIDVTSEPCVGTTFTITLPEDPNKESAKGTSSRSKLQSKEILSAVLDSSTIHSGIPPYGI